MKTRHLSARLTLGLFLQEGDLRQIFEPFGAVESVSVQKDGRAPQNFGFVQYVQSLLTMALIISRLNILAALEASISAHHCRLEQDHQMVRIDSRYCLPFLQPQCRSNFAKRSPQRDIYTERSA